MTLFWQNPAPNLTKFALKYSLFIQFLYLFPKHVYMVLFTLDKAPWSFLNVFWLYLGPTLAKKGFYLTWYAEKCFLCIVNLLTKNLPVELWLSAHKKELTWEVFYIYLNDLDVCTVLTDRVTDPHKYCSTDFQNLLT